MGPIALSQLGETVQLGEWIFCFVSLDLGRAISEEQQFRKPFYSKLAQVYRSSARNSAFRRLHGWILDICSHFHASTKAEVEVLSRLLYSIAGDEVAAGSSIVYFVR